MIRYPGLQFRRAHPEHVSPSIRASYLNLALVLISFAAGCSGEHSRPTDDGKHPPSVPQALREPRTEFTQEPKPGEVRVELTHEIIYNYDHAIRLGEQILRLHPFLGDAVPTAGYSVSVEPEEHSLRWQQDDFGNTIARVTIPNRVSRFSISVHLVADVREDDRALPRASEPLGPLPYSYPDATRAKLSQYLTTSPPERELERYILAAAKSGPSVLEFALSLNRAIARDVRYAERLDPGVQSPLETLKLRSGACRDSAWLLVQTLRQAGIAARFVSGYLVNLAQPDSDVKNDSLALHAWCEFYLANTGWIGLDTTSGKPTSLMHIPLAAARSPELVAPLEGMAERAQTDLQFPMRVRRIAAKANSP